MISAEYDKIVENWKNKIDVKLVSNKKDYIKWVLNPSYKSQKIFDNHLVAICKNKVTLILKKPTYVGICILELSKVIMSKLHSQYVKNKYGNNSRLLFTDIDSLIYEVKHEDIYEDLGSHKEMFNFIIYSTKSK